VSDLFERQRQISRENYYFIYLFYFFSGVSGSQQKTDIYPMFRYHPSLPSTATPMTNVPHQNGAVKKDGPTFAHF
jgi:hypothetical protein